MRRLPPLNAVRAFEAAARRGNFNQAAEELNVTPSAISHQVRSLEEFFGIKLFQRSGRSVELTTKSRDFLRSVTQALDQVSAASQRMMRRPEGNLLNISVSDFRHRLAGAAHFRVPGRPPGTRNPHDDGHGFGGFSEFRH